MSVAKTIYHENPDPVDGAESGGGGGAWSKVLSIGEQSDRILGWVRDAFALHGWTVVLLVVVWYNLKDPARRRWRRWQK